jgi:ACS family D-galactonate transporter-like MFS transporter
MGDSDSTNRTRLSGTLVGVLILLWLSVFLNYIDRSNLSIAAPLLKGELGLSATQLGVLLSAFFWTYACLQIPAGWLVDRFEVKWVFAGGFLIWSAATAVTGVLHSFAALLAVRVVLGMGESAAYPSYSKIIANHFPVERRGFANSVVASGLCFGPSFGMLFGGTLMGRFGWRPFFVTLGLASLLWIGPWSIWMPRAKSHADDGNKKGPGLQEIVARRAWVATALGLFAMNYVNYFLLTWLPFYLVRERGFSMNAMAEVGGAIMLTAAVSAVVSGKLSDRWIRAGATTTRIRSGFIVTGNLMTGTLLMAAVVAPRDVSVGLLMLVGVGFGMASANVWAITQTLAGPRVAGRWAGSQNFIGNLSGAVAPALTGVLVDRTGHFFWPFLITGAVAWSGAAVWTFLLGPIEPVVWRSSDPFPSTRVTPSLRSSASLVNRSASFNRSAAGIGHVQQLDALGD